jgi:predicted amidophosphoribosyltransferase
MKCPWCEHENPQGAGFCEECATPLARICSNDCSINPDTPEPLLAAVREAARAGL